MNDAAADKAASGNFLRFLIRNKSINGPSAMLNRFSAILIVDDSATTRRAVRIMLEQIGLKNVHEADCGKAALKLMQGRTFALVISDWLMEPMSGLELLERIRSSERTAKWPFIMMTTQSGRKFIDVARDKGATHYLAKPFDVSTLAAKLGIVRDGMVAA